ncbi:MAG: hypothetical protein ACKVXR_10270 [Planctomycetota bacterium]
MPEIATTPVFAAALARSRVLDRGTLTAMTSGITGLEAGYLLDRLWHSMRGEAERSKQPALTALARVLKESGVSYAVIGGVALQIHQRDPRTTLDIDIAVAARKSIPRERLLAAGFRPTGDFEHSENWEGPGLVPIQFTDDPALIESIARAETLDAGGIEIRVLRKRDLLREKLRAGADPARRRSKRLQDLSDAQALVEEDPSLAAGLDAAQRALLDRLP